MPRSASVFEGGTVEGEGLVVGEDDIASGRQMRRRARQAKSAVIIKAGQQRVSVAVSATPS